MSGYVTPEGLVIPLGSDTYDYVNDQKRLSSSIRSIVPVASNTAFNTVATAMNADGRPTTDSAPLFAWNSTAKGLQYQGTGSGPLPLMAAIPFAHAGATGGFQSIGNTLTVVNLGAGQHLAGGMTFGSNGLTVPIPGYYRINVSYYVSGAGTGMALSYVYKNGTTTQVGINLRFNKSTTDDYCQHAVGVVLLAANDVITLEGQHTGTFSTWGSSGYDGTFLEMEYMGAV